jgi:hypothetical protein
MEKQLLPIVVVFLFCLLYTVAIAAQTRDAAEDGKRGGDINAGVEESEPRALVQNLGFGRRVDVKLKDGSKTTGRITGVAADRFVVTNEKGGVRSIPYAEISRITKHNEKFGLFDKPWAGIMFTAAGVGTLIVLALALCD